MVMISLSLSTKKIDDKNFASSLGCSLASFTFLLVYWSTIWVQCDDTKIKKLEKQLFNLKVAKNLLWSSNGVEHLFSAERCIFFNQNAGLAVFQTLSAVLSSQTKEFKIANGIAYAIAG